MRAPTVDDVGLVPIDFVGVLLLALVVPDFEDPPSVDVLKVTFPLLDGVAPVPGELLDFPAVFKLGLVDVAGCLVSSGAFLFLEEGIVIQL